MIYLIGGTPRSGKTTLAKKLAKDLNVSWISADTLEGLAQHFTTSKEFKKKFPKTSIRQSTDNSNDAMYSKYTAKQITKAYIEQAKSSWEVIQVLIDWLTGENFDYIIEGYQVAPKFANDLSKKYGKKKIKAIFLTHHDIKSIVTAAKQGKDPNDWFINKTKDQSTYPKIAEMIKEHGDYTRSQASKYGFKFINMDKDFVKNIDKGLKYLLS